MSEPEIYCPECKWRPGPSDLWVCSRNDYGTVWNTFWTGGVCPGCAYQWRNTSCLSCDAFPSHKSWYHYPPPPECEVVEKDLEVVSD